MKHLVKITFNIMVNQQYQQVDHYCASYKEENDTLNLYDDKKNLLCCFKKAAILKFEVETIDNGTTDTKKKKTA